VHAYRVAPPSNSYGSCVFTSLSCYNLCTSPITHVLLQPQVLAMLSGLRTLHLESVALLLPAAPGDGDADGEDEPHEEDASEVALLEALGQLTQLEVRWTPWN